MEKHLRALHKSREALLKLPNVVGVGVGLKQVGGESTGDYALIIFVGKKIPPAGLSRAQQVPHRIEGLKTDVVEIGRVRLLDLRTRRERPARPGMSIGHYRVTAGTFGAVVRDRASGEKLILSNNHILANATDGRDGRAAVGDPILQPAPYDGGREGDRIATLLRFAPLQRSVRETDCPAATAVIRMANMLVHAVRPHYDLKMVKRQRAGNAIDAALARPVSPDLIDDDILEVGRVNAVAGVAPGQEIMKSGRTSGLSRGKVMAVGVTLEVEIIDNERAWFVDQVVTDMASSPGDSGSLVVDGQKRAVGLLFAGSDKYTIFNRMETVLSRLEVDIETAPGV
ncbi:hypothetical protein GFC01_13305 [Desulfofundulus thermobenzoicus]|uniref:Serine protease n=1 Tax=Desulfofundulus thermobenzoicus TaxID=29376 RepID=A0A6N7IUU9_9FIRM|nr:hypothetical protein [Desulfofundulus thermobenzoicus]MQL53217.1 hypothetical protein [Desulfofundulus thermobenzoicus]HHW43827.1 hypothetical protein [Desulfotomaculum sp.]